MCIGLRPCLRKAGRHAGGHAASCTHSARAAGIACCCPSSCTLCLHGSSMAAAVHARLVGATCNKAQPLWPQRRVCLEMVCCSGARTEAGGGAVVLLRVRAAAAGACGAVCRAVTLCSIVGCANQQQERLERRLGMYSDGRCVCARACVVVHAGRRCMEAALELHKLNEFVAGAACRLIYYHHCMLGSMDGGHREVCWWLPQRWCRDVSMIATCNRFGRRTVPDTVLLPGCSGRKCQPSDTGFGSLHCLAGRRQQRIAHRLAFLNLQSNDHRLGDDERCC